MLPAFPTVVERHGPMVWRVCRSMLTATDAEDAWSETFLAALQAYPRLDGDAHLAGWLATIAHHKAVDRLRAGARARPVADVPDVAVRDTARDPDPALWAAVRALPDRQRHALVLRHVADLPYVDVAAAMGGTPAAARRAAADALAALRTTLADHPDAPPPLEAR